MTDEQRSRRPIFIATLDSTLAEQASKSSGPERARAKEIFLGIDAHWDSNQVARKIDNGAILPVQSLGFKELPLFAHKHQTSR